MQREPAVAGQFYPDNIVALTKMLEDFCPQNAQKEVAPGIMVPHAGYVFSGAIAGRCIPGLRFRIKLSCWALIITVSDTRAQCMLRGAGRRHLAKLLSMKHWRSP